MSNELRQRLNALLASIGFNDGANKGFWRVQPREKLGEDAGQWIEMGAELRMYYKNKKGEVASVSGRAVGSTGTPDGVRVLVKGKGKEGVPDGVYGANTANVRVAEAILSDELLEKQGIENKPNLTDEQQASLPTIDQLERADITDEDIRLINDGIDSPEAKEQADYKKSVEAKESEEKASKDPQMSPREIIDRIDATRPKPDLTVEDVLDGKDDDKFNEKYIDWLDESSPWVEIKNDPKKDSKATSVRRREKAKLLEKALGRNLEMEELNALKLNPGGDGGNPLETGPEWDRYHKKLIDDMRAELSKDAPAAEEVVPTSAPKEERPLRYGDRTVRDAPRTDLRFVDQDLSELTPEQVSEMIREARRLYVGSPIETPTLDRHDQAAQEAYRAAFEEAKSPNKDKKMSKDELVDSAIAKVNSEPKTKKVKAYNLDRGMTIVAGPERKQLTIADIDLEAGWVKLLDSEGKPVPAFDPKDPKNAGKGDPLKHRIKTNGEYTVLDGKQPLPKPAKPVKPAPTPKPAPDQAKPTPAKPAKPVKPAKPAPTPPTPPPAPTPTPLPNRVDDGKDIPPITTPVEELRNKKIQNVIDPITGKLLRVPTSTGKGTKTVEDPNAIIDALLEVNPNAKIKPDGTIVMERGTFTDTDGKTYKYEVGVQRTVGNQFMERYTLSDPETGEVVYDFYNHDYKDSFAALYSKTSGLYRTRDYLLGNDVPGLQGVDENGVPRDGELRNYFGPDKNLEQRLKYLRKTKDMDNWRLITPEENEEKHLSGRDRKLNQSDNPMNKSYRSQFGNVLRSFLPDIYKAIKDGDQDAVKEILVQTLGRLPDNQNAKDSLIRTLQKGIDARFKGTPDYDRVKQLPRTLNRWLIQENLDIRDKDKIPFVSEDGVTVVSPGDRVRFVSNEGDFSVGTVVKLIPASGKNGNYKDTARVKFANGKVVDLLQTRNMQILDPEDPDNKPTEYKPWVRLDEKIRRRADELGIDYETWRRRKQDNPDYDPADPKDNSASLTSDLLSTAGAQNLLKKLTESFGKVPENKDNTTLNARGNRAYGSASAIEVHKPTAEQIYGATASPDFQENDTLLKVSDGTGVVVKPTPQAREKKDEILAIGASFYQELEKKLAALDVERKAELDKRKVEANADQEKASAAYYEALEIEGNKLDEVADYLGEIAKVRGYGSGSLAQEAAHLELMKEKDPKYLALRDEANKLKATTQGLSTSLSQALSNLDEILTDFNKEFGSRSEAIRKLMKSELESAGVSLDTVKVADFGDNLTFKGDPAGNQWNSRSKEGLMADMDRVFEYIPRPLLEALLENGVKIQVVATKRRGNMSDRGSDVDGSKAYRIETNVRDDGSTFEVTLHELWHVFQAQNPDLVPLEHALMYDRLVDSNGKIPSERKVFGNTKDQERMLDSGGQDPFARPYSQKYYKSYRDNGALLSGDAMATEVTTVLMQDLFANQTLLIGGEGEGRLIMKPSSKGKLVRRLGEDVYYNSADGKYYEDASFSIPVSEQDIASYAGKPAGVKDTTSIHFALGLLIGYGKSNG